MSLAGLSFDIGSSSGGAFVLNDADVGEGERDSEESESDLEEEGVCGDEGLDVEASKSFRWEKAARTSCSVCS